MKNTIRFAAFILSLTLLSCGGGEHSATDTGSASFGLTFEEASAPAMKLAPSMAPAADICSNYGIDSISGTVYNSSNSVIATGGPWACSAHQGTINNIPTGSNLRVAIKGTVSGSVVWQGETTGKIIYAGQDTNVGSIPMTYTGNDTIRPTVSAATPTGTTVPLTSPITVTFSESMASSTIDTTTFTLKNGAVAVSGSVSYNATTKTATFTPTASLSNSVIYTATVTTDVTDMAANKMQSLYTWGFTTEAPPGSAPTTPIGLSATAADKQVTISWTAVTGATSYNIYWSTASGVTKTNGTPITGATSPYIHTGLTNGTIYYYVVTAVNSYGESTASSQVSATPGLPPSAPTGVLATAGDGQGTISWSSVATATSYNIYWSTISGVTKTTGAKITGAASPYTHTGLSNGTTYYYIVTAENYIGESAASTEVSATLALILASNLSWPGAIIGDSTSVYWLDNVGNGGSGAVKKVSTNGGTVTTLASGLSLAEVGIAVDSTSVYWTENGTVKKVNINGGTVTTLASGLTWPGCIAVDSTSAYWTENGAVKKVNINGGTVTTLASGLVGPNFIAVNSTSVYWGENGGNSGLGTVKKVNINGGTVTTLASGLTYPAGIAIDSTSVYWTESNSVNRVNINGGTVTTLASGLINGPNAISVDSTTVYWAEWGGTVKKVGVNGGAVTTIASSLSNPTGMTIDSTSIYWTEYYGGTVKKVPKN